MKQLAILCVLTLLAVQGAYATTPGSVQPVPEDEYYEEPGIPEEGDIPGDLPEYEEPRLPSPRPAPRPAPMPRPAPRPLPPPQEDDLEREYPSDEEKGPDLPGQPPMNPPHRPGRPHHPRPPRRSHSEVVQIRQQFLGQAQLPLYMLTNNLMQLQGYRLVGLTIFGYSQAGMGGAFFCSSQCSAIQPVGGYPGAYRIQTVGEPINQFAGQWFLELRGNFAIETIQLEFVQ